MFPTTLQASFFVNQSQTHYERDFSRAIFSGHFDKKGATIMTKSNAWLEIRTFNLF